MGGSARGRRADGPFSEAGRRHPRRDAARAHRAHGVGPRARPRGTLARPGDRVLGPVSAGFCPAPPHRAAGGRATGGAAAPPGAAAAAALVGVDEDEDDKEDEDGNLGSSQLPLPTIVGKVARPKNISCKFLNIVQPYHRTGSFI